MKVSKVTLLEEAVNDLEIGRDFYDGQQEGIGVYFVTSLLLDTNSLYL